MTVYNAVLQGWFGPEPDIALEVNPAHHRDLLEAQGLVNRDGLNFNGED
ncbi:hypothetical protein G6R29_01795 [Fructobacillus sp. M2-14]|uniref:Uncharacterized protein n=1 Tax=Fructobacillus broussonetiae TaxID=2713173 RepID=A0ABS5QYU0_9LACO|nr:hypothetical protein [Fructobacillus broussonetiae]MBS9338368.1 hypothetical protein [Fructobacillus broussonetiae]